MYKCKECGTEFEIKPDYCDCGNDTFDMITPEIKKEPEPEQKTQDEQPNLQIPTNSEKIKHEQKQKTKEYISYSPFDKLKENFDPISTLIFLGCVILSLIIIFFVGNPKQKEIQTEELSIPQQQNIPSVDTFWDNTPPKIDTIKISQTDKSTTPSLEQQSEQKTQPKDKIIFEPKTKNNIEKKVATNNTIPTTQKNYIEQQQKPSTTKNNTTKTQPIKTVQTPQIQNTTVTKQQPTNQNNNNTQNQSQTNLNVAALTQRVQTNAQTSANKIQEQQKKLNQAQNTNYTPQNQTVQNQNKTLPQTNTTSQNSIQNTNKTTTPVNSNNLQTIKTEQQTQTPKVDLMAQKQEFANYKISLRNTIGKKINFTNVIGDGDCVVSFKIASNGQITNRMFTKKSNNLTLNDAVYSAMLSTPSFNPPPAVYKNETLNLKVSFYNGNFDISLY